MNSSLNVSASDGVLKKRLLQKVLVRKDQHPSIRYWSHQDIVTTLVVMPRYFFSLTLRVSLNRENRVVREGWFY